jgi:hypothetical protein
MPLFSEEQGSFNYRFSCFKVTAGALYDKWYGSMVLDLMGTQDTTSSSLILNKTTTL